MVRSTSRARKPKGIRVDLSNVGKAFEAGQEYLVRCVECTIEEGTKGPYFSLKLNGADPDHEQSVMYHNASTSPESLWRLRPLLEAFGIEIEEGPMDISPDDFVDKVAMCSTYLDKYEGGSRVKPDEFWAPEDGEEEDDAATEEAAEFDLDELDDDQIKELAEAVEVTGKTVTLLKKKLKAMDQDELAEAFAELGGDAPEGETDDEEVDVAELDDDTVKALGAKLDISAKTVARIRKALETVDAKKLKAAMAEAGAKTEYTEEELDAMNQDELQAVIDQHELDVDLGEFKTLRKMKNAVLDALEEAELMAEG